MRRYRSLPELAELLERAAREGRSPRLSSETAVVVAAALRAYSAHPTREDVMRALCTAKGGCNARTCWTCMGKANAIMRVYAGGSSPFEGFDLRGPGK